QSLLAVTHVSSTECIFPHGITTNRPLYTDAPAVPAGPRAADPAERDTRTTYAPGASAPACNVCVYAPGGQGSCHTTRPLASCMVSVPFCTKASKESTVAPALGLGAMCSCCAWPAPCSA